MVTIVETIEIEAEDGAVEFTMVSSHVTRLTLALECRDTGAPTSSRAPGASSSCTISS